LNKFILSVQEADPGKQEELDLEQVQGLYSFDGRDLSMELEELHERVAGVESERATKAVQLSQLVMEISNALANLGVFPIRDIPAHPKSAGRECLWCWTLGLKLCLCGAAMTPVYPVCRFSLFLTCM
jgi:hypothetical protein